MYNIKAIILDVDGVIIGERIGFNTPHPHKDVIKALKIIRNNNIPIVLCTAKPHFAIGKEIKDAYLNNIHITDGGGVIVDPLNNIIMKQNNIFTKSAVQVIEAFLKNNVYTEFYTVEDYFIQNNQVDNITQKHAHVIQKQPAKVGSLVEKAKSQKITKIMPIATDENDKYRLEEIFKPFNNDLVLNWGVHPAVLPLQFGIITAKGISKRQAAIEVSKFLKIPFENILGIGDSESDWQFIELCKYTAAMGNASEALKEKVLTKGKMDSFIAPIVDENGIIDVFKYFKLI